MSVIIPRRKISWGWNIVLALSDRPSSFHPSRRLWTTESWLKAHCEVTCLLPLTMWESCQLLTKIWGKHWLWHPGRSLKTDYLWNGLKSANNGVKPGTDKDKQVADNRQWKLMNTKLFYSSCYFGGGYEFSLNLLVLFDFRMLYSSFMEMSYHFIE